MDWKLLEIGSARLGRRVTGALCNHVSLLGIKPMNLLAKEANGHIA